MPVSDCSFVLGLRPADFGTLVFFVFRLADIRELAGRTMQKVDALSEEEYAELAVYAADEV